jgi:hypothetical protein
LGGGPPCFPRGFTCPVVLWISSVAFLFRLQDYYLLWWAFPDLFDYNSLDLCELSATPTPVGIGLGSFPFARRYLGNRLFFLFLQVLRCFSSLGMSSCTYEFSTGYLALAKWVSPFGDLRITAYLRLPAAYRSLSRPSSTPGAKASTMRPF